VCARLPSRLRVPAGYALGVLVVLMARPSLGSVAVGLALATVGEALRIWASGHIDKTRALATGGPYAHTRNPLYLGSMLIGLGVAVGSSSPWVVLAVAAYFAAFYPSVMREEAAFLEERFSERYRGWARQVPSFVPRLWPAGPRDSRFRWSTVASNREWRTVLALPAMAALLYLRGLIGR